MSEQLPTELFQFGTPAAEFSSKGRFSTLLRDVAIGFGVIVVGVVLEIVGLSGFGILIAVMGAIFMVVRGFALLGVLISGTQRAFVFNEAVGFVKGDQVTTMRWSDVRELYQDIYTYRVNFVPIINRHNYTLNGADGSKIQFTRSIHKIEELGPILHQAVTKQQMPKAVDTLKAGSTVSFGPIAISNQGMTLKNKLIPWNEIKSVRVNNGAIMVDRSGKITWSGISASSADVTIRRNLEHGLGIPSGQIPPGRILGRILLRQFPSRASLIPTCTAAPIRRQLMDL